MAPEPYFFSPFILMSLSAGGKCEEWTGNLRRRKQKKPYKTIDKEGPLWVREQGLNQVRSETQSTIDSSRY